MQYKLLFFCPYSDKNDYAFQIRELCKGICKVYYPLFKNKTTAVQRMAVKLGRVGEVGCNDLTS